MPAYLNQRCQVLTFNRASGYGFLVSLDHPEIPDIFVHYTSVEPTPCWRRRFVLPGFNVICDIEFKSGDVDENEPEAKNVRVVPPVVIAVQRSTSARGAK